MTPNELPPHGIWMPLVTPFSGGALDEPSLRRLARHAVAQPIDGLIICATAGEGLTVDEDEKRRIVDVVSDEVDGSDRAVPLYLCLSGSDTRRVCVAMDDTAGWPLAGYLLNAPAYSRPSQEGLFRHFEAIAGRTDRPCMVYNIPYRSGVNINNETMLRLAGLANLVGVKDCGANIDQSFELMARAPDGFSVLTGEDGFFYTALVHGGAGGILMTSHVLAQHFADIRRRLQEGDQPGALGAWRTVSDIPPLLFAEPSPAPVKHWLWRTGVIDSPELRLPMTGVSDALALRIDAAIERIAALDN